MKKMEWLDIKEFVKNMYKYIILIITILIIAINVVGFQQIVGSSMEPTFKNKDIVILDKITYRFKEINRNDIVSFHYDDSKYLIKRVIGLPGDFIEYKNNILYINKEAVEENYLHGVTTNDFSLKDLGYDIIPDDMYLVLGDNRTYSQDSRDSKIGLVKRSDIIGEVRFRILPLQEIARFQ